MRIKTALGMNPPQMAAVIYVEIRQPKENKCGSDPAIPFLEPSTVPGT